MEEKLKIVLAEYGVSKKILDTLINITFSLIKSKTVSIRQMADYMPTNTSKQVKVNRIWRFINKSKLFKPISIYKAIIRLIFTIYKVKQIVIDFTALKGHDIKLFIASVPFIGRSIPIYCKPLFLSDIHSLKYNSENEFIIKQIEALMEILPKDKEITILADRQFSSKKFIKIFNEKNIDFVIRIKEKVKIKIGNKEKLIKDLNEGVYKIEIDEIECYLYKKEDNKDNMVIISSKKLKDLKRALKIYKRRSLCENMHRDLKSKLNLLFLNKKYYKEMNNLKVEKYLVLFLLSEVLGIFIGYLGKKNKEIYRKFISKKDEKSLFNLGQLLIIMDLFSDLYAYFMHFIYKIINLRPVT